MMNLVWNPKNIYDENTENVNKEDSNNNSENTKEKNIPWNAKNIYD